MVVLKITPDERVVLINMPIENFRDAIGADYKMHKVPKEKTAIEDYVILYSEQGGKYNSLASKLTFNAFNIFGNAVICGITDGSITDLTDEFIDGLLRIVLILFNPTFVDLRLKKEDKSESN